MVRPCVARELSSSWRMCGLASMYPAFDWSLLCSGPSWVSARVRSHYRRGLNGPFGSPVFACAGKTDPPSRFILSQTSAGKTFRRLALRSRGLNLGCLECSTMSQNAPSDASELVGERDGEDVVMQPLLGCFEPRLEPVTIPAPGLDQYSPCGLNE